MPYIEAGKSDFWMCLFLQTTVLRKLLKLSNWDAFP